MSLFSCCGIYFGDYAGGACNNSGLGLSAAHTTQPAGDEGNPRQSLICGTSEVFPSRIQNRDGGTMNDSLWTDVHVGASRHLTILTDTERVKSLAVLLTRVIRNHHPIGHHHSGGICVGRKQPEGMAGIHHESLVFRHLTEVSHRQSILCPVLENCTVASVGNQFVRKLGDGGVEIILNHHHD